MDMVLSSTTPVRRTSASLNQVPASAIARAWSMDAAHGPIVAEPYTMGHWLSATMILSGARYTYLDAAGMTPEAT